MNIIDHDLLSIQEARILIENAHEASQQLKEFPQEKLDEIVEKMAQAISIHTKDLAKMSCDETDYGIWEDKYIKNRFASEYIPKKIKSMKCVGIIKKDCEEMMMEVGVPVGVIVNLCPATSPVSTAIYATLIGIKSGNAMIFSPHPRAKKTMEKTLDIMMEAAYANGLPEGALKYLSNLSIAGTIEMMNHKSTSLIINTGVPNLLEDAYKSGKPVIYGGTGNGPVFIERTADIKKAILDIVASKTFDNGVVSSAEKAIVVDRPIEKEVRKELKLNGGYFMTSEESEKLKNLLYDKFNNLNSECVGKSAYDLGKKVGFAVDSNTTLLISEQKYVSLDNPYSKEHLCPVIAYYVEDDWINACEKCIELLITELSGHTLVIHSRDEEVIEQFALKKPVGRVLVNTSGTFGGMGITTNMFPAMTLGSGSAGKGITTDNVSPMNLVYIRKIGYGVRNLEDIGFGSQNLNFQKLMIKSKDNNENEDNLQLLQKAFEEVLKSLNR